MYKELSVNIDIHVSHDLSGKINIKKDIITRMNVIDGFNKNNKNSKENNDSSQREI